MQALPLINAHMTALWYLINTTPHEEEDAHFTEERAVRVALAKQWAHMTSACRAARVTMP